MTLLQKDCEIGGQVKREEWSTNACKDSDRAATGVVDVEESYCCCSLQAAAAPPIRQYQNSPLTQALLLEMMRVVSVLLVSLLPQMLVAGKSTV